MLSLQFDVWNYNRTELQETYKQQTKAHFIRIGYQILKILDQCMIMFVVHFHTRTTVTHSGVRVDIYFRWVEYVK